MRNRTKFCHCMWFRQVQHIHEKQGKLGTVAYPKPGLLLEDVLADVLHLLKQSLTLGLYQVCPGHLVGSLA